MAYQIRRPPFTTFPMEGQRVSPPEEKRLNIGPRLPDRGPDLGGAASCLSFPLSGALKQSLAVTSQSHLWKVMWLCLKGVPTGERERESHTALPLRTDGSVARSHHYNPVMLSSFCLPIQHICCRSNPSAPSNLSCPLLSVICSSLFHNFQ